MPTAEWVNPLRKSNWSEVNNQSRWLAMWVVCRSPRRFSKHRSENTFTVLAQDFVCAFVQIYFQKKQRKDQFWFKAPNIFPNIITPIDRNVFWNVTLAQSITSGAENRFMSVSCCVVWRWNREAAAEKQTDSQPGVNASLPLRVTSGLQRSAVHMY